MKRIALLLLVLSALAFAHGPNIPPDPWDWSQQK